MNKISFESVVTFDNLMMSYQIIRKNTEHKKKIVRYEIFLSISILIFLKLRSDKSIALLQVMVLGSICSLLP